MYSHAELLPKALGGKYLQNSLDGLDSDDIDVVIRSYASVSSESVLCATKSGSSSSSKISHPAIDNLRWRFNNQSDQALAALCKHACYQSLRRKISVSHYCQVLANCVDRYESYSQTKGSKMKSSCSSEDSVRYRALGNTKIALCVNRYIRQNMITALSRTVRWRAEELDNLMYETGLLCKPSDCPGREKPRDICKRHGYYHGYAFYRHLNADGGLIHLNVRSYRLNVHIHN